MVRIFKCAIRSKHGSAIVEAAFVLPVIVIVTGMLIRMFVFCLETLDNGIKEHLEALESDKRSVTEDLVVRAGEAVE